MSLNSGFSILTKMEILYNEFLLRFPRSQVIYSAPSTQMRFADLKKKYVGLDREGLSPYSGSSDPAERMFDDLAERSLANEILVCSIEEAQKIMSHSTKKETLEIIWSKAIEEIIIPPTGFVSAGFEPAWYETGFSALCDCMHMPRWHGTDEEGTLFLEHYNKLNSNGLFNDSQAAQNFIEYYLSFDWTEHVEYKIVEIFFRN